MTGLINTPEIMGGTVQGLWDRTADGALDEVCLCVHAGGLLKLGDFIYKCSMSIIYELMCSKCIQYLWIVQIHFSLSIESAH